MTRFEHFSATIPHAQSVMIGVALWDGENVTYAYQARQQAHRETLAWHAWRRVMAAAACPGGVPAPVYGDWTGEALAMRAGEF